MWTEQETKRYEEHLEKHWTRDGQYIPPPLRPSVTFDSTDMKGLRKHMKGMIREIQQTPSGLAMLLKRNA